MKTTKKLCVAVMAIMLAVLLAFTAFSFVGQISFGTKSASAAANHIAANVNLPSEVTFGDTITVSATEAGAYPTVKAPNGTTVTLNENHSFVTDQLGLYSYTYEMGAGLAPYTLYTYVTLEEDFFLKVDDNGADIPTYIAKNGTFTLPGAGVYYNDDDNIMRAYPVASDVTITVTDSLGATHKVGDTVTASNNGKLYIYYTAKVGNKYFSQTFTVNVQTGFTDNEIPELTVTGVPNTASVNRSVSIPVATVSDDFDENIKVTITVVDPEGNAVKNVDIDDNGFAYQTEGKTYEDIKFDNDKVMSFYPLVDGRYVVKYVATDDAGRTSGVQTFNIDVSDKAAPVLAEIDEYMIPSTWGMSVNSDADANDYSESQGKSGKITFPVPTYVDNLTASSDIVVYFRITDSDRNKTVLEFTNINTDGDDSKFTATASGAYGETDTQYTFNASNLFTFDLTQYRRPTEEDSTALDEDKTGTYTVLYRAKDANGNTSSKSYTITINDTFSDTDAPSTVELDVPKYISVTDESFTVPTPSVADRSSIDTRLQVNYSIYNAVGEFIKVEGGEKLNIVSSEGNYFFELDKHPETKLQLPQNGNIYFFVEAIDDCGNKTTNATDGTYLTSENVVKVVNASAIATPFTADFTNLVPNEGEASVEQNIGGFNIKTSLDMRYFTGFEVNVYEQDAEGNFYNLATTLTTFSTVSGENVTIYVNNINVTPGRAGLHTVTIRVFDVSGNSSLYSTSFEVKAGASGGTDTQAAVSIPTTGAINTKYILKNETMSNIGEAGNTYYVVRKITGSSYSLMGSELTARNQGLYYFNDGYVQDSNVSDTLSFDDKDKVTEYSMGYQIDVTDSVAPVIEVQGTMPSYWAKSEILNLPSIVGISPNGNVKVTVTVVDKQSRPVVVTFDEATNRYSFTPTLDGDYTVTVTATINNATPVPATYTISVGDVVGPVFTLDSTANQRLTVGKKFEYAKMTLDSSESSTGVTIRKYILDPSKSTIDSATVSGSYTTYNDYKDNGTDITFDRSGTYTIVYEATDSAGNTTVLKTTVTVSASGSSVNTSMTTISIVLIVLAVLLLAGVIVYVFRFRKVKR